ncbi:MAG TPA: hypothetical protein PKI19_12985 [Elusimicrobiales bacterium]|nr:hypothetical protein [Elusimicrobiales bacterium]
MNAGSILFTALILVAGTGPVFAAKTAAAAAPAAAAAVQADKETGFREMLVKLMRQDEELDAALQKLDSAKPLSVRELDTVGLTLKLIAGSLGQVSVQNRLQFSAVGPDAGVGSYTNAILSYSRKFDRKTARISALTAALSGKTKKAAVRDAVSSKKSKKAAGKKIEQLLAEQTAVQTLAADANKLRRASRDLAATSKWLYIASK